MTRNCLFLCLMLAACNRHNPGYSPGTDGTSGGRTNGGTGSSGGASGGVSGGTNGGTIGGISGGTNGSSAGTNGSSAGTNGTSGGVMCTVESFTLTKESIAELILVQDRSGSMDALADGSPDTGSSDPMSKWNQMKAAVENVVASTPAVEWGLEMFPEVGHDNDITGGCSVGPLDVTLASNTSTLINGALSAALPGGLTPTAGAINNAVQSFANDGHPHFIVLATDGEPTCAIDAAMLGDPTQDAITAVQNAVTAGVHVFVVGIGTVGIDQQTLSTLANDGLEPNTTAGEKPYYEVSSTGELETVLNKVAGQITTCSYALPAQPTFPNLVQLTNGGVVVPRDTGHIDGWDFGPMNTSIELYGAACQNVTSLQALFDCPG